MGANCIQQRLRRTQVVAKGKGDSRGKEGPWESIMFRAKGFGFPGGEQLPRCHWLRSAKEVFQLQRGEGGGTCLGVAFKIRTRSN